MKSNKTNNEGNRSDFNEYFAHKKKKCDIQQQSSKISKSFDQSSESDKNNNNDDSFYDWDDNNRKLESTNINRVNSELPKVNGCDGEFRHEQDEEEDSKTPEEDEQRKQMLNQYEMRKEEPSLVSEYVVGNSPKDESSSEQINEENKSQTNKKNGSVRDQKIEKRKKNMKLEVMTNPNQKENQNIEFSNQFLSSEIRAHIQMREQELRKPINLNVIIIGKSGIGKSTFIDAFLDVKFEKQTTDIRPTTTEIVERQAVRKEGDMTFNLNMIDTPGYEDSSDITQWKMDIIQYITSKFDQYKEDEKNSLKKNNKNTQEDIKDSRIHGCLYFLTGPRISQIDIENLQILQKYVSIIPILAKGDSYTLDEVKQIKLQLKQDAEKNKIDFFDVEDIFKDQPDKFSKFQKSPFGPVPPFLIISSVKKIKINENEVIYGRQYNWGLCDIKNPNHSDFMLLYTLLIGLFSVKLIKLVTVYYKQYLGEQKKIKKAEVKEKETLKKGLLAFIIPSALSIGGYFIYKSLPKN